MVGDTGTVEKIVFSSFGVEIVERSGRIFIRADSGGIGSFTTEDEVSEAEAAKARLSEQDAYEVLLSIERAKGR